MAFWESIDSDLTSASAAFRNAENFNQDISGWEVSSVENMEAMFSGAREFNQDIGDWDTKSVEVMNEMFFEADSFNQDISGWDVSSVTSAVDFSEGADQRPDVTIGLDPDNAWTRQEHPFRDVVSDNLENPTGDFGDWDSEIVEVVPTTSFYPTRSTAVDPTSSTWRRSNPGYTFEANVGITTDGPMLDASQMFEDNTTFNDPDVSIWVTSSITNALEMFSGATSFNQEIGNWDVSNIINAEAMFGGATAFNNGDSDSIRNWQPTSVNNARRMFQSAENFNQPVGDWDVSSFTSMEQMFQTARVFNQPLNNWNVSNVTNMELMLQNTSFNLPLDNWDVSNVRDMRLMFQVSPFNQDIGNWDVSSVTDMEGMFRGATDFNNGGSNSIGNWNVSSVTNMEQMFWDSTSFNQDIGNWDVSSVTNMDIMFFRASSFNQDLSQWCVENINSEPNSFDNDATAWTDASWRPVWGTCPVIDPIPSPTFFPLGQTATDPTSSTWQTNNPGYTFEANVGITTATPMTNASQMFADNATFNDSDVSRWDTSQIQNTNSMFSGCSAFNRPLASWDTSSITNMGSMFNNARSFNQNIGSWDVSSVTDFGFMFSACRAFNNGGSPDIQNWTTTSASRFDAMFNDCRTFNQPVGSWDTSNVRNMRFMFNNCVVFNQPLNTWNTSNVSSFRAMLQNCETFNQPVDSWNTSSVTNMSFVFSGCTNFNQSIGWDVSNATTTQGMFANCENFNQNISSWNVSNVTDFGSMFDGAERFNQNLGSWNISSGTNYGFMFSRCSAFNNGGSPDIQNWVINTTDSEISMRAMFQNCDAFNQPLNNWNVSNITNFSSMFRLCDIFNQPLDTWDVSDATDVAFMFQDADSYTQDLSSWNLDSIVFNQNGDTTDNNGQNSNQGIFNFCGLVNTYRPESVGRTIGGVTYTEETARGFARERMPYIWTGEYLADGVTRNRRNLRDGVLEFPTQDAVYYEQTSNHADEIGTLGDSSTNPNPSDFAALRRTIAGESYSTRGMRNYPLRNTSDWHASSDGRGFDGFFPNNQATGTSNNGAPSPWFFVPNNGFFTDAAFTNLSRMFHNNPRFNDPDIGRWVVNGVTSLRGMFSTNGTLSSSIEVYLDGTATTITNPTSLVWGQSPTIVTLYTTYENDPDQPVATSVAQATIENTQFNQDISFWVTDDVTDISGFANNSNSFNTVISSRNSIIRNQIDCDAPTVDITIGGFSQRCQNVTDTHPEAGTTNTLPRWNLPNVTAANSVFNGKDETDSASPRDGTTFSWNIPAGVLVETGGPPWDSLTTDQLTVGYNLFHDVTITRGFS